MGEKNKKSLFTKERIIAGGVGLVIGIIIMVIAGFATGAFAKTTLLAKLKNGEDAIATVKGKTISTQTIYDRTKKMYGFDYLMNEIDSIILNEKYPTLTEKEEEQANEEAKNAITRYEAQGYTEEQFLLGNGFYDYNDFLNYIKVQIKGNKYIYDFLESKLEEGAVKKYYDENKELVETYDTEHILVRITDDVKEKDALATANEIIKKLDEGKTFEDIVNEYGDKIIHEELGFYGKDANLEQSYIDEMIALEDGAYSKTPVKTSYGYHIVHRLGTATFEDLRGTIIEKLSEDLLAKDPKIIYKALIDLRKESNLEIFDQDLKKEYDEYCASLYETE